jgi:hypothetical protein
MVEYNYQEARTLLETQKVNCERTLVELSDDLLFLKDQITTTEVNIARIYNFDVKNRKKAAAS